MSDDPVIPPPVVPWFRPEEAAALADFFRVYEATVDFRQALRSVPDHPTATELTAALAAGDAASMRAVLSHAIAGEWGAYEAGLRAKGAFYARTGFRQWDGIALTLERQILPRIVEAYHGEPARLVAALLVSRGFFARVRQTLDESYEETLQAAARDALTSLKASEERYRILFEGSPLPIMLFDLETLRFLAANEAAVRLYGYSREELLELGVLDLKPAVEGDRTTDEIRRLPQGTVNVGVRRQRKRDGTPLEVDVTAHRMTIAGRATVLQICTDVTAARRAEELQRHAEKMQAIVQLAGGVAHDFNNLFAVILASAGIAEGALPGEHPARTEIEAIATATRKAAALTDQLLAFSRHRSSESRPLALDALVADMNAVIEGLVDGTSPALPERGPHKGARILVTVSLDAAGAWVHADPVHLRQVVVNLVANARDAMPSGGTLTIRTSTVSVDATRAAAMGILASPYVILTVNDTGAGMDATTRARIFEPFFTTKEVGQGSGLGLAATLGLVQQSGGAVDVDSAPGRGSSFSVYLPRVDPPATAATEATAPRSRKSEEPRSSQPRLQAGGGDETILVVEDDDQVRRVVRKVLGNRGYTVIEATQGKEALEILAKGVKVDLVVTDMVMPDMDGRTMALRALEKYPSLRILYMSGYTEHTAMKGGALGPKDRFLHKPFSVQELSNAVRSALDAPR